MRRGGGGRRRYVRSEQLLISVRPDGDYFAVLRIATYRRTTLSTGSPHQSILVHRDWWRLPVDRLASRWGRPSIGSAQLQGSWCIRPPVRISTRAARKSHLRKMHQYTNVDFGLHATIGCGIYRLCVPNSGPECAQITEHAYFATNMLVGPCVHARLQVDDITTAAMH